MDLSPCIRYAIHPSIHPPIYTSYLPPNQSLTHLASLASTASHTLDTSSSHARELHQHHLDATHSASHLVHTLGQLADTAHDEIRKINDTAVLVRRGFFREEEKGFLWGLKPMLVHVAEVVLRGKSYFSIPTESILLTSNLFSS